MLDTILKRQLHSLIQEAFHEDLEDRGDITSISTLSEDICGKAELILKMKGVIAGLPLLQPICHYIDSDIQIQLFTEDGQMLPSGFTIAKFRGSLRSILICERTALNFLQRLSGIATITKQYVDRISHTKAKILDTRKTTPGLRALEKYAVCQGGGMNHRSGLFDMILIKDNHIDACGGIDNAITRCLNYLKLKKMTVPIEVETRTLHEVREALRFPIQRIMLDNMSVQTMSEAIRLINERIETEASGNIRLENVKKIAETGVNFISVGALTHSANALDISMDIAKE